MILFKQYHAVQMLTKREADRYNYFCLFGVIL